MAYGKGFDAGPPKVVVVFGHFPWAPGRLSYPSRPYFRVCVSVAVLMSTETSS